MAVKKTNLQFQLEIDDRNALNPGCSIEIASNQEYVNMDTLMEFVCCNGHQNFTTKPRYILTKGAGCPKCGAESAGRKNAVGLSDFKTRLCIRNAEHLPVVDYVSGFVGTTKKALFECTECSTQWHTTPKSVLAGSGCPRCSAKERIQKSFLTLAEFNLRLVHRNATTDQSAIHLAPGAQYLGVMTKTTFVCSVGHIWDALPNGIIHNEVGCPHCAGTVSRDVETAVGEITSKWPNLTITSKHHYQLGRREPIDAQCEYNHSWTTHYERLMNGHYCPHCNGNARYDDATFKQKLLKVNKQVEVLGLYVNATTPIEVKCIKCSHEWKSRPYNLINGYGCPQCSKNNKFSKKAMTWLKYIEKTEHIELQHAMQYGEFKIPGTRFKCDGYCAATNTVYEFYGDYWHGNPDTTDPVAYNTHLSKTFGHLYTHTMEREQAIKALGFNIVSIWEADFDKFIATDFLSQVLSHLDAKSLSVVTNTPALVELQNDNLYIAVINVNVPPENDNRGTTNDLLLHGKALGKQPIILFSDELEVDGPLVNHKIRHYLGDNDVQKIHARQCVIKQCSKQEKQQLLNANHVQGNDNAPVYYGAFYENKIVAIMSYTPPRVALGGGKDKTKDNTGVWELSRFCTDVAYRIPGIASKLLTHFKRNNPWKQIYSYADKRWSVGNMYHQLGFTLIADNPPDYFYVVDGKRKHRWNFRKDMLKNSLPNYTAALTEYQNMQNHGYYRIWDCGTLKFSITQQLSTTV